MPKINQLPRAQSLAGTDLLPKDNTSGTSTEGVSASQIADYVKTTLPSLDSTLTQEAHPADAKAVGDALDNKQNTLTFDTTPTGGSLNPVTSGGVKSALDTKQNTLTFDSTPTASSTNPVTSGGVKAALDTKQGNLTFDSTPTAGSNNPVTSAGIKTALDTKQNTLTFDNVPTNGSNNPVKSDGVFDADEAIRGSIAPAYSTSAKYAVGDYVMYNGSLYRCSTAINSGESWTAAHWTVAKIGSDVTDLKTQLDNKVNRFTVEGTPVNLPVQTTDKKYIELSESGKVYNSNGNLFDICGLVDGTYNSGYGITLTVTNKSHIAISGTATQAHYIKITDGVQGGLTRSGCGANLKSFDYPIGDNFYLCFRKNIANSILAYVVASDGTVATGGNSLQNDRAFKLENYDNWAGVALYVSNGYEVPSGVEIDVSLQIGGLTNPYMAPNTDIISAFSSGIVDGNGLIASNKSGTATSVIEFDPEQVLDDIDNLYNKINYFGKVSGTGSNIYIESDKTSYNVAHIVNTTINADLWRVYSGSVKVGENWEYLWNGQDADGVVSIKGEADFIGGFHGDEILTDFAIYIDGVEQTNLTFTEKPYNEIVIYQESNVYHCNASETPTVVAFKRNKVLVFNAQGYTVKNYWVAQEELELTTAYFGMLSVQKYQADGTSIMDNGYYTNVDYKYHDNSTGFNNNPDLTMVTFNTAGGDITIEAKGMTPGNYKGNVSTYLSTPERFKVYMGPIIATTATAVTVNQGDVLKGEARIYVK